MNRSQRVAVAVVGVILVCVGLGQIGAQAPSANEHQRTSVRAVDLRCEVQQPTTILSVVPDGTAVKKGDLLIELDNSPLVDRRIAQVAGVQKAESEMLVARESQDREKRAAAGQLALAEKALRLAQTHLKAFTEGEYPDQLALAEGTAAIASQKRLMAEEHFKELQVSEKGLALQQADIARMEAQLQLRQAENSLVLLKGVGRENKIAELELVVAQREFDLLRAKDAESAATTSGAAALSLAEMTFHMERDRLAKLDDQIVKCRIIAPQDGTVVYLDDAVALKPSAVVRGGQVLVRLLPAKP